MGMWYRGNFNMSFFSTICDIIEILCALEFVSIIYIHTSSIKGGGKYRRPIRFKLALSVACNALDFSSWINSSPTFKLHKPLSNFRICAICFFRMPELIGRPGTICEILSISMYVPFSFDGLHLREPREEGSLRKSCQHQIWTTMIYRWNQLENV